jgi:protein-S-isoprenylcysteine O-methyltransferase Ste14
VSVVYVVAYFAAWAVLHSTLASLRVKRLARRWFGEGARCWYRFAFVLVAVLLLVPLVILMFLLPNRTLYVVPSPWRWLMIAGQATAFAGMVWTVRATDATDFIGLRQLRGGGATFEPHLVRRGLYRWVRHPMYTTSLLVMWLVPTMSSNLLALFASMSVYFVVGSYHEEKLLLHQFGAEYEDYRRRVPRLIPGLRPLGRSR